MSTAQKTATKPDLLSRPDWMEIDRRIRRSDLSYAAQALLLAILERDRYGENPAGCTASMGTLAAEINTCREYVRRLLRKLAQGAWVVLDPQQGNERPIRMGPACTEGRDARPELTIVAPQPREPERPSEPPANVAPTCFTPRHRRRAAYLAGEKGLPVDQYLDGLLAGVIDEEFRRSAT